MSCERTRHVNYRRQISFKLHKKCRRSLLNKLITVCIVKQYNLNKMYLAVIPVTKWYGGYKSHSVTKKPSSCCFERQIEYDHICIDDQSVYLSNRFGEAVCHLVSIDKVVVLISVTYTKGL